MDEKKTSTAHLDFSLHLTVGGQQVGRNLVVQVFRATPTFATHTSVFSLIIDALKSGAPLVSDSPDSVLRNVGG